jgi:hypothetical protein
LLQTPPSFPSFWSCFRKAGASSHDFSRGNSRTATPPFLRRPKVQKRERIGAYVIDYPSFSSWTRFSEAGARCPGTPVTGLLETRTTTPASFLRLGVQLIVNNAPRRPRAATTVQLGTRPQLRITKTFKQFFVARCQGLRLLTSAAEVFEGPTLLPA